jgi:hypothetical protein
VDIEATRAPKPKPLSIKAVGTILRVTAKERLAAKAWNIYAIDEARAERAEARRQRNAAREMVRRRDLGAEPREQYVANSNARQKPSEAEGISRATWWRRERKRKDGCPKNDQIGRRWPSSDKAGGGERPPDRRAGGLGR